MTRTETRQVSKLNGINYRIPPAYSCFKKWSRYKVAYGGRGSGKSWVFALMALSVAKKWPGQLILCLREIQRSIEDSVYRLLVNLIQNDPEFIILKNEIVNTRTKSRFIFKGLHRNIASIKSLEGVNIAWVEEAHSVSQESWDYLIPTIRAENSQIWITFNPDQATDPVYEMFVLNQREGAIVRKFNYTDNPYFPETLRLEMEYDKRIDTEKYLWIWEGELREQTDAQVFRNKFRVDNFTAPAGVDFMFGADFGFSADPSTLNRCYIVDKTLFIDYEAHGIHTDIDKLPELYANVPGSRDWVLRADCSRPDTINYLRRHGYPRIQGPEKLKIEDGISYMRSFEEIVIHERCKHTIDEFKLYSYVVDKHTGDVTPKLEDKHNHHIDGLRYALYPLIKQMNGMQVPEVSIY